MTRRISLLALAIAPVLVACGGARKPAARPESTGASSVMTSQDFQSSQPSRMEDLLARVPGLEVQRAGADFKLRIRGGARGTTSCAGLSSDEPLVVIDGMSVGQGRNSIALSGINPQDVDRVEVLRDAGSTAVYGCQGINGVVLIRTKVRR